MKRLVLLTILSAMLAAACTPDRRPLLVLTTNDIHARIDDFPRLATAVAAARDTAEVILIDAGDRWTGNAYVDLAEDRLPIIDLMNELRYDVGTLGNHEFDGGQEALQRAVGHARFPIVCANMRSDSGALHALPPYLLLDRYGLRLGVVGVVTNYGPNNHPDGNDAIFEGLTFTDAVATAAGYAALADSCDLLVALTHIGSAKDRELAVAAPCYDLIIGGHSHEEIDERIGEVLLTQTGKNLRNVGVVEVLRRRGRPVGLTCRLVPLKDYAPDPVYVARVDSIYANPYLHEPVSQLASPADKTGLAHLFASAVRRAGAAEIGFYHHGGVRLDTLPAGDVIRARIFDLDPFDSHVSVLKMTPAQMRRLILRKFNDRINPSESHRLDLHSTTPYTILTDAGGEAVDVLFPSLSEGRTYRVAMGDYVFNNYGGLEYEAGGTTAVKVTDALLDELNASGAPYRPDNTPRQTIR